MTKFNPRWIIPGLGLFAGFSMIALVVLWMAALAFAPD
jgi:uncharacterized membrane protein YesL